MSKTIWGENYDQAEITKYVNIMLYTCNGNLFLKHNFHADYKTFKILFSDLSQVALISFSPAIQDTVDDLSCCWKLTFQIPYQMDTSVLCLNIYLLLH